MSGIKTIEGGVNPEAGVKVGVISSRFNSFIVDHLEKGCLETLRRHGLPEAAVTIARVPGAFEIPVVAQRMAKKKESLIRKDKKKGKKRKSERNARLKS